MRQYYRHKSIYPKMYTSSSRKPRRYRSKKERWWQNEPFLDKEPQEERSQDVFSERSERSPTRSPTVFPDIKKRSWNEKTTKIERFERYGTVKRVIFLCALIACFALTLTERPDLEQIAAYIVAFAVFMCMDPYDALYNVCAPQTRYICASVSVMILAGFYFPQKRFRLIVAFLSFLSMVLCVTMNKTWLSAFFWRNTEEVQKALRIDSEHTAAKAWQAHGARETYTLLCKLGLDETEKIDNQKLHIFYKPVYLCGYLHGIKKAAVLEGESVKYQICAAQYDNLLEEYNELNEKYKNTLFESMELKRQADEPKDIQFWKKKFEQEEKRANALGNANEELIASIDSPEYYIKEQEKQDDLKGRSMQERIKECHAAGMSYGEIAKFVGCSKTTAYKYAKKESSPI